MEKPKKGERDDRPYFERLDATAKGRYAEKISLIDGNDPYQTPKRNWCTNPDSFPNLDYFGIVNYFVFGTSAYSMQAFKAYKSLQAYKTFVAGWVRDISTYTPDGCDHSVTTAKVSILLFICFEIS